MKNPVLKIFEEADIDQNGKITYEEFEHIVIKSPEFPKYSCFSTLFKFQDDF